MEEELLGDVGHIPLPEAAVPDPAAALAQLQAMQQQQAAAMQGLIEQFNALHNVVQGMYMAGAAAPAAAPGAAIPAAAPGAAAPAVAVGAAGPALPAGAAGATGPAGAAGPAAAAGGAVPPWAAAPSVGHPVRSKYRVPSLATSADGREVSGRLNMTLSSWRVAAELALNLNGVPPTNWVQAAIVNGMEGHVQTVALQMLESLMLPDWGALLEQLRANFEPHEQKRIAASALERLRMQGHTVAALERYVARSRELHITAAELVTEERKWNYFMRGLPSDDSKLLTTVMEATSQPHTFEAASSLALKALAHRLQPAPPTASADGAEPMDLAALRWYQQQQQHKYQQQPPKPPGPGKQFSSQKPGPGKAGGGRIGKDAKGKGLVPPGPWRPQLSQQERRRLISQHLCLCCKKEKHSWMECPRNPDIKGGNA